MHKIVRRIINHKYTAIDPNMIKEGSIINFDCYIKRFDDFVIIIERGTLISAQLARQVKQNEKIYISLDEKDAFNNYKKIVNLENNEITLEIINLQHSVSQVMQLREKCNAATNSFKKLEMVYPTTALLMEAIFNESTEKLPLDAIDICTKLLVESLEGDDCTIMGNVLRLMPDEYSTDHHSVNVAIFSIILGKSIGLKKEELLLLAYAALMHDIGKVRIDSMVLQKPSELDEEEYLLIQTHSNSGCEILQNNGLNNLKILDAIRYHHEKLDGKGYPEGLRGKRIPKFARIIGMCDVFDALTTRRTYRNNYSSYEALLLMKEQMAHQFDEHYSDTFIRLLAAS